MAIRGSRRWVWILGFLAIVGGGLLVHAKPALLGSKEAGPGKAKLEFAESAADSAAQAASGARLSTAPVESVERPATLRVTGSLVADEDSDVASNVSGLVKEVCVDRGSFVKKGDVLVQIDPADAENTLAEGTAQAEELRIRLALDKPDAPFVPENMPECRVALSARELADSQFRRAEELYGKKVISTDQYDQACTQRDTCRFKCELALQQARQLYQSYQTALARLQTLRKALADTTIRAPFDGWVAERKVAVGERLSTLNPMGCPVAILVRLDPIRVSLTVPQQNIGQVRPGQTVDFTIDSYPGRTFQAEVRYIAPKLTAEGRSLTVEAVASNPDMALRPGLFVTAKLELPRIEKEIYVPAGAVKTEEEVGRVFVVRDGAAHEQVVSLGPTRDGRTRVFAGLQAGDVVVLNPAKVKDGTPVRK